MNASFKDQVKRKLFDISQKDTRFFAWLCAVRALPFLGAKGNFDYWIQSKNGDKRQKHLLSVLKAADAAAYTAYTGSNGTYITYGADVNDASTDAYFAASYVVDAAIAAANTAFFAAYAAADVTDAAVAAADAAVEADAAFKLRSILLDDLENIRAKKYIFQNDISVYAGGVWDNFQRALRDVGCEYWGDWYAKVFAKSFILDDDDYAEIEMRLGVPGEIMEQGATRVARYVMELKEKGVERLNETRVIILGNKGSGKTSLAWRLKEPTRDMPKEVESTEGVDVIDWTVPVDSRQFNGDGGVVNVHVWDFAGHVITHAAHRCFMSERCLYVLVVDGRTEGDSRTGYWLEQIRNYGGDSPVLVLVNVRDKNRVDLPENTLKKEFPSIIGFHSVDINAGGEQLEVFRQIVMTVLRDKPYWRDQKISRPCYKVKEALRQKFAQGNNFITMDDFDQITKSNGVPSNEQGQLLKDLHDLGICLHYDKENMHEFGVMVLNPNWISHGIYRLINWGLNEKRDNMYKISVSDFDAIFVDKDSLNYPKEKAVFLFQLMKTFQLAFFKDSQVKDPDEIFVPLLFSADRPETGVPDFVFGERLRMEYHASQALPPYTVARLAALHSKELNKETSWRFGAVLHWADTVALVEESTNARSVTVYVKGSKQTEYITRLRSTLDAIFNDYKSNRPELKYEVILPNDLINDFIVKKSLTSTDANKLLQSATNLIGNARIGQHVITNADNIPPVDPKQTILVYNITAEGATLNFNNIVRTTHVENTNGNVLIGSHIVDEHTEVNLSFKECSGNFQGELNSLARKFRRSKILEKDKFAEELEEAAHDLDDSIKEIPANVTPSSTEMKDVKFLLRKNGLLTQLENLYGELCDEKSNIRRKIDELGENKSLQKLWKCYEIVAPWLGLAVKVATSG
ncbi:MAG: hypothetical protein LBH62_00775 [Nitrososphaerota archaeon]|jgi:GTPase SAR1 family protein|nr:hypothetical protein [Nitrososphaerota archaeon]